MTTAGAHSSSSLCCCVDALEKDSLKNYPRQQKSKSAAPQTKFTRRAQATAPPWSNIQKKRAACDPRAASELLHRLSASQCFVDVCSTSITCLHICNETLVHLSSSAVSPWLHKHCAPLVAPSPGRNTLLSPDSFPGGLQLHAEHKQRMCFCGGGWCCGWCLCGVGLKDRSDPAGL